MMVSPFWSLCSGRFARKDKGKGRAGADSDSVNHRFCLGEEKKFRRIFPHPAHGRQLLPGLGKFCPGGTAIYSAFYEIASEKPRKCRIKFDPCRNRAW